MKAFGKFDPHARLPLRRFEVYFGIKARDGAEGWKSSYESVQKLLNHLARYTRSDGSREKYLDLLRRFCEWSGYNPNELSQLPKEKVESLIQSFADELAAMDRSKAYVNSVIKKLKTFFRSNGYKDLDIATHFVPTRYRKRPEYVPTKEEVYAMADAAGSLRNRAIILFLWSSGLRVSTLCALNYGDVADEVEGGETHIMVPVYPEMKGRVADACKGNIPYYTFICMEAGEALRSYLREREEKYGIAREEPLFSSAWTLWQRDERPSKRLGRRGVLLIVKRAAKLAGIEKWRYVSPHCLRKAFESVLVSPTIDGGRLDKATQEFFMGHILPGTQDVYYDKTKVDFHRKEYAKLDFSRSKAARTTDKLIDIEELEAHFSEGWTFVAKVSDSKVVVRRKFL
ncbi:MAG: tyrosine-type recombinase/integrase [Archaeoglobus sp.]|nr:tyrosine-type recombinase/integrase [Archaeoglobus sp.]